jgi:Tfp pilus assembly protein FimT
LIELVMVMALLCAIVIAAAPMLSRFFRGQTVAGEGQRFLAMTRYAQSRAVSEGVPMVVWLNAQDGSYGVKPQEGFVSVADVAAVDTEAGERPAGVGRDYNFQLPERMHFFMEANPTASSSQTLIRFVPDGAIDENSLRRVTIRHDDGLEMAVEIADNQLNYVIAKNTNESPSY